MIGIRNPDFDSGVQDDNVLDPIPIYRFRSPDDLVLK